MFTTPFSRSYNTNVTDPLSAPAYYFFRARLVYYDNFLLYMELDTIKCMDCVEYLKSLPDDCVDLVLTDPPYNVSQRQNMTFGGRPILKNFGEWASMIERNSTSKPLSQFLSQTLAFSFGVV